MPAPTNKQTRVRYQFQKKEYNRQNFAHISIPSNFKEYKGTNHPFVGLKLSSQRLVKGVLGCRYSFRALLRLKKC